MTYKSINGHKFITLTRRDDLESVIYCLIYFLKGDLPWNKENVNLMYNRLNRKILKKDILTDEEYDKLITKNKIIYELKERIPVKILCDDLPTEFELLIHYVRNLKFYETPNYDIMKDLLKRVIFNNINNSDEGEYKYIWEKKFVTIMNKSYKIKKIELEQLKTKLFSGYNIEIEKFIRDLKKIDLINFQSLKL